MSEREWKPLSMDEYHAHPAFGSGAIRCFVMKGQLEFWATYIANVMEKSESDAMRLGRAFHAALEDEKGWRSRYKRIPTEIEDDEFVPAINGAIKDGSTKSPLHIGMPLYLKLPSHREYLQAHKDRAARLGLDFIDGNEVDRIEGQVAAVYDNAAIRELLSDKNSMNVEVACFMKHKSGLELKTLCDLVIGDAVIDWKSTCMRNPYSFLRDAIKRGYDYQAAHTCLVTGKSRFLFGSVSDAFPYEANLWEVPARIIEQRMEDIERHCFAIAEMERMSVIDDKDSQGVPHSWHSEGWGTCLPLDINEFMEASA